LDFQVTKNLFHQLNYFRIHRIATRSRTPFDTAGSARSTRPSWPIGSCRASSRSSMLWRWSKSLKGDLLSKWLVHRIRPICKECV
jgi:hypothetical protein